MAASHSETLQVESKEPDVTCENIFKNKVNYILNDFEEISVLGVGSFGKVKLVKVKGSDHQTYALKEVRKRRVIETGQEEHIVNERRVMGILSSPFCVQMFATYQTQTAVYFLLEPVLGTCKYVVLVVVVSSFFLLFISPFSMHTHVYTRGCKTYITNIKKIKIKKIKKIKKRWRIVYIIEIQQKI